MESKLLFFLILAVIWFSSLASAQVIINEIMYEPASEFGGSGNEWFEVYSNQTINISRWKFYENGIKHGLTLIKGNELIDGYAVIAKNSGKFLIYYPGFNGTLFSSSFSLDDDGEYLALKNSSFDIVDEVNYSSSWGGGNGYSLELINAGLDNNKGSNWGTSYVQNGTPGEINSVSILGLPCDRSISITLDKFVVNATEKVYFTPLTQGDNFTIEYWIEDLSGKIVKSKITTSTTNQKSWTPTSKGKPFLIFARLISTDCHDITNDNNNASVLFYVLSYQEGRANIDFTNIFINEFLPDPIGSDDNEFIELYNPTEQVFDLSGFYFEDDARNKLFISHSNTNSPIITPFGYLIVYRGGSSFALNNNGFETIKFLDPLGGLINQTSYDHSSEGMSWSKIKGQWRESKPTPGEENYFEEECDWKINIDMNNSIFQSKDLKFTVSVERNYGFEQSITVKGIIENIFNKKIKSYNPWTNKKVIESYAEVADYSPDLAEGIYAVKFEILNLSCNESDLNNNQATKLIAINPEYRKSGSILEIETLYLGNDDKVEWADQFTAKVHIYKGNETKESIQLWVEKDGEVVSTRSKLNIYDEFQDYYLTLPIQLHPNCANEDGSDGTAKLILEGLGKRVEKELLVEGIDPEVCKEYADYIKDKEKEELKEKKNNAYQLIDLPVEINPGGVMRVKLQIWSDKKRSYKVWSYLYRGSKCYSCSSGKKEREENAVEVKLDEDELNMVEILVAADDDLKEGEYNLMVKINKDNQKTSTGISQKIYVDSLSGLGEENKTLIQSYDNLGLLSGEAEVSEYKGISAEKEKILSQLTGIVVYESSSEKAKKLIPFILAITFGLMVIVLIWRK